MGGGVSAKRASSQAFMSWFDRGSEAYASSSGMTSSACWNVNPATANRSSGSREARSDGSREGVCPAACAERHDDFEWPRGVGLLRISRLQGKDSDGERRERGEPVRAEEVVAVETGHSGVEVPAEGGRQHRRTRVADRQYKRVELFDTVAPRFDHFGEPKRFTF